MLEGLGISPPVAPEDPLASEAIVGWPGGSLLLIAGVLCFRLADRWGAVSIPAVVEAPIGGAWKLPASKLPTRLGPCCLDLELSQAPECVFSCLLFDVGLLAEDFCHENTKPIW